MGKDRDNRFIKGLLVGGAAASLFALLLAPKGLALRSGPTSCAEARDGGPEERLRPLR